MPGQKFPSHNLHQIHLCDFSFDPGSVCDMIINFHRDTDVRMSHYILNNLHIQIRLCHPGTGRMSENMWTCQVWDKKISFFLPEST